tara:strand:- start:187 stop:528 length:342 start_codon:yes stop_codon:yes gene_type:complete
MSNKIQSTNLHKNFGLAISKLELWAENPWRRYSLYLIFFLIGFFLGSSLGMINGALSMMDPIGAFVTVLFLELLIRIRRISRLSRNYPSTLKVIDMLRIGIIYGLFMEGFKLL